MFCDNPIYLKSLGFSVPCGKCPACDANYSRMWAVRVAREASRYDRNCFVTLTYDDAKIHSYRSTDRVELSKDHLQRFIKRLRKHFGVGSCRYFACGEYGGGIGHRPHYHVILFGFDFDDKYLFRTDKLGNQIYRSNTLEKLWQYGYSCIGDKIDVRSAVYLCKYMSKTLRHVDAETPPFILASRRPPIGTIGVNSNHLFYGLYLDGKRVKVSRSMINQIAKNEPDAVKAYTMWHKESLRKKEFMDSGRYVYSSDLLPYFYFESPSFSKAEDMRKYRLKNYNKSDKIP